MTEECLVLSDGRRLGFATFGDPHGRAVIYAHGFPACRLEAELLDGAAREVGAWLIAPDRPGFGRSDFQPAREILDWPGDVAQLADALGLARFSLLGGSAGCPFALATGYRLPERTRRVALVAGLAPMVRQDVRRRMGRVARLGFVLARRMPPVYRLSFGALAAVVARYPALNFRLNKATPPDQAVLADPAVRSVLEATIREAFRNGTRGAVHELDLLARDWGFRLRDVVPLVTVWHGDADGVVPPDMGRLMAAEVPGATLRMLPGEGHISLPHRHGPAILGDLLASS